MFLRYRTSLIWQQAITSSILPEFSLSFKKSQTSNLCPKLVVVVFCAWYLPNIYDFTLFSIILLVSKICFLLWIPLPRTYCLNFLCQVSLYFHLFSKVVIISDRSLVIFLPDKFWTGEVPEMETVPTRGHRKTLTRVGFEPTTFEFWSPWLHWPSFTARTGTNAQMGIFGSWHSTATYHIQLLRSFIHQCYTANVHYVSRTELAREIQLIDWSLAGKQGKLFFFCAFDQAITGAIYFTFHNGKNRLSIVQITYQFKLFTLRFLSRKNVEKKFRKPEIMFGQ